MPYYCRIYSAGSMPDTNLQLYSLQEAAKGWNELVKEVTTRGNAGVDNLTGKAAFVLSCLGLSLSQLLGQNSPSSDNDKIDEPNDLLNSILVRGDVDRSTRRRLNREFQEFLPYYDTVRHFGKNRDEKKYRTIEKLTMQELDRFRRMTIEIWDVIIGIYQKDNQDDFKGFRSICEFVWFDDPSRMGTFDLA
jgi:hypothetical protein